MDTCIPTHHVCGFLASRASCKLEQAIPLPRGCKKSHSIYTVQGKHSGPPFHRVTVFLSLLSAKAPRGEAPIQDTQQGTRTSTFAQAESKHWWKGVREGERQLNPVQVPHTMGSLARPKKVAEAGLALLSI